MKYIIDIPEDMVKDGFVVKCEQAFCGNNRRVVANLFPEEYEEPDHSVIEDKVWELARLISLASYDGGLKYSELYSCFGSGSIQDVMKTHSYQEAKAKYETWKKEKDEIRVGDEVKHKEFGWKAFVTNISKSGCLTIMWSSGEASRRYYPEEFEKTGRHCAEVEEFVKKIGEMYV